MLGWCSWSGWAILSEAQVARPRERRRTGLRIWPPSKQPTVLDFLVGDSIPGKVPRNEQNLLGAVIGHHDVSVVSLRRGRSDRAGPFTLPEWGETSSAHCSGLGELRRRRVRSEHSEFPGGEVMTMSSSFGGGNSDDCRSMRLRVTGLPCLRSLRG